MKEYVETVKSFKDAGIRFIGQMDSGDQHLKLNIPAIDTTLEETLSKYRPDSIVIGYPGDLSHKSEQILKACYNDVIPIQILPDLTYSFVGHQIDDFAGIPILSFNQPRLSLADHFIKRVFDFVSTLLRICERKT